MAGKKHKGMLMLFWFAMGAIVTGGCIAENNFIQTPSMLAPQGPIAGSITNLTWFMIILGSVIFIGVMLYLAYAIWGSRENDLEEELKRPNRGTGFILTWGVGANALVLLLLFGLNIGTMRANNRMSTEEGLVIDVIGRQWWWEIQYTQQGFETANEIRIPVGQAVTLRLTTRDVIHSLWIPELSGKLDLLPKKENQLTLFAGETGEYLGECAEFCGTQHANMNLLVIAQTEEEFAAWLEHQQTIPAPPESELAMEGMQLFQTLRCAECHNVEGTTASGDLGPDLTHLMSRRSIGAGMIEFSLGQEALWILDSQGIKPGNMMPSFDLSDRELAALLAYLETLE